MLSYETGLRPFGDPPSAIHQVMLVPADPGAPLPPTQEVANIEDAPTLPERDSSGPGIDLMAEVIPSLSKGFTREALEASDDFQWKPTQGGQKAVLACSPIDALQTPVLHMQITCSAPGELEVTVATDADNRLEHTLRIDDAGKHAFTLPLRAMRRVGFPDLRQIEQLEFQRTGDEPGSWEMTISDLRFIAEE